MAATKAPYRPTDCTPTIIAQVHDAVAIGLSATDASALAGISRGSFHGWQARARTELALRDEGHEPRETEQPFVDFLHAVTRAHLLGQRRNAQRIEDAATPHDVVTRTVKMEAMRDAKGRIVYEDGAPVMVTTLDQVVIREGEYDWKAALEVLRRRHRSDWGDSSRMELTGKDGGPLELSVEERQVLVLEAARQHRAHKPRKPKQIEERASAD